MIWFKRRTRNFNSYLTVSSSGSLRQAKSTAPPRPRSQADGILMPRCSYNSRNFPGPRIKIASASLQNDAVRAHATRVGAGRNRRADWIAAEHPARAMSPPRFPQPAAFAETAFPERRLPLRLASCVSAHSANVSSESKYKSYFKWSVKYSQGSSADPYSRQICGRVS